MVNSTYDGFLCTGATIHGKIVKPTVTINLKILWYQQFSDAGHLSGRAMMNPSTPLDHYLQDFVHTCWRVGWRNRVWSNFWFLK